VPDPFQFFILLSFLILYWSRQKLCDRSAIQFLTKTIYFCRDQVRFISFQNCHSLTGRFLGALENLKNLKGLDLQYCSSLPLGILERWVWSATGLHVFEKLWVDQISLEDERKTMFPCFRSTCTSVGLEIDIQQCETCFDITSSVITCSQCQRMACASCKVCCLQPCVITVSMHADFFPQQKDSINRLKPFQACGCW